MAIVVWLIAAYVGICLAAYLGNRLLMYIPDPSRTRPAEVGLDGVREIEITVDDGIRLVAWHAPAKKNQPTILYFHGNAPRNAWRHCKFKRTGG